MVRSLRSGRWAVPVLIDLPLPRFAAPDFQTKRLRSWWVATQESPASLSPLTSPSLCLNLDTLSSDESAGPGNVSAHPICISDVSSHSSDLDQVLSGEDLPSSVHVDLVSPASPTLSARVQQSLLHDSPPAAPVTLSAESAPISPNRVRSDCTPGTLDAGPVFEVSHTTGFLLRAGDTAMPASPVGSPAPLGTAFDRSPQLGEPVAFNLSQAVTGSDAPVVMSFPVYPLPSGMVLMPVSCSSQTISAPGVSSHQGQWSSAMPQTRDVSREGPFDAYCAHMDTGVCPLVSTGLPGNPYRITSYTGPAVADTDSAFGIQMHHPRFVEFIGHLSLLGCYSVLRPFGFKTWIWRMLFGRR